MLRKIINNFILYSIAFLIALFLHKGTFIPHAGYEMYYAAFIFSWALSCLISRKFKEQKGYELVNELYTITVSFFLMLGILGLIIYKFDLTGVSRFVIISSLIISFSIEISYLLYKNKKKINFRHINVIYSSKAFTFDVLLFGIINLYLIYKLKGNLDFDSQNIVLFINLYLCWFAGAFLGHQFHPQHMSRDYWAFIWQYIKAYIIILALASFSGFINRLDMNEIIEIIYGILSYSILSFAGISLFYYIKRHRILSLKIAGFQVKGESGDILLNERISDTKTQYRSSFSENDSELMNSKFRNFSLMKYPEVYEFLDKSIDLSTFDYSSSIIIKSNNISNIDYMPEGKLQFLLNLEKVNQIQNINKYLVEINNKLMEEGVFAGNFETVYLRHQKFLKRYPYYFAQFFYFIDFLWNRVFSKIIILRTIYLGLTGGTHKAISLAEGLGRLYYSGFEILNLKIIDDTMFFIAKKIKGPINKVSPSSGIIFKMNRLGKNGRPIIVYKLRTMHPYAEYLQDFIYEKFNLKEGGKFKNDFRITYWGRILRKLWLDELPMLYNWLKRDLKLVGPRPLSQHYFNLYKSELKIKRLRCKPGLIPPFYADNPKTLDEIMSSEAKYLTAYEEKPLATDLIYLIKCIINILFKGARSS